MNGWAPGANRKVLYLVSASLRLLAGILLIWALIGLYAPQSKAAGTFGLWAFVTAFFGAALNLGNRWAELFVWPTLGLVAPDVISGKATQAPSYLVSGISLSAPLLGIGVILFGIATFLARVYPRWAAALLIVSIPVTILLPPTPGTFQESIGQILFGIAFAVLGWHALQNPTPSGQKPNRTLEAIKGPNSSRDQFDHLRSRSIPSLTGPQRSRPTAARTDYLMAKSKPNSAISPSPATARRCARPTVASPHTHVVAVEHRATDQVGSF